MVSAENCSVGHQVAEEGGGAGCATARKFRETMFSGDDFPRLWSGEDERTSLNVDGSRINGPRQSAQNLAPTAAYLGNLRVSIPSRADVTTADIQEIRRYGDARFNPDETVSVRFDRAPLDFFLRQLLTGALGVTYVVPDDLQGTVTFRTEEPLPKSQVLQVVRDILGRRGLVMKNLNGVYHIDRGDVVASIEAASRAGRDGDQMTRLIKVPRGNAAEIAAIVKQLVPEDVVLVPAARSELVVKASTQSDLTSVSDLVASLAKGAVGDDSVAVLPLTRGSPVRIAAQLSEFYRTRLGGGTPEAVTVIPLEAQNAILVGTRDSQIMAGIRALAAQLDRNAQDEMTVRIIALTHLDADEMAQRLTAIMGAGNRGGGTSGPMASLARAPVASGSAEKAAGAIPAVTPDWPYGSLPGAAPSDTPAGATRTANASAAASANAARATDAVGSGDAAGIKFEPDTRNNSILVHSTYATFRRVQELVKVLDVPQAQVVIEATIAEVTLTDDLQFGVQAYLSGKGFTARNASSSTASDNGSSGTFANLGFSVGNVKANIILQALQTVTSVKVISSPYLTVLDKKTARLVIGDQIPFAQSTQTSNNAGTTTITESVQTKDTGVVLEVTPKINANNSVSLTVDQQITKPADSAFQGNKTPVISTRQVKSDILVQSGRTFVLGGLIQERLDKTESGTPGLRAVPVLGDLFKPQQENKASRVELLVMITPRVVRQASDLERITRLLRDQLHVR